MKIAIAGKGGVGKTTLAGVMARYLAEEGYKVLTIDADPDANLASALGFPPELLKGVTPLAEMTPLVEERTGAKKGTFSGVFRLNPKVDDIPDTYSVTHHGVKLLTVGSIPQAEGGCFCPENILLKGLLHHILVKRDEMVIIDMEAGLEHLTRGSTKHVDAFIIVVEPGQRSISTAKQIRRLALDLGVQKVYGVGNKVTSPEDRALIEKGLSELSFLGHLSFNQKVIEADKQGISPYDLDGAIKKEVQEIVKRLQGEPSA
ncbi:MAG: carbon monoxide dehydrogenase [Deltaproteobacteria bacterium RBG_16_54_11]|jgi:CO dehydrogenase maturation factor|nr:MAG: carbon monoxide dehydrogenase [Deltaproteobacteria bacterium RBG_16_54_11]